MKTIYPETATACHPLAEAVLKQLGGMDPETIDTAIDAGRNGADAGWPGFTYYKDTCAFTAANRKAIRAAVESMAQEIGETPMQLVKGFRGLGKDTDDAAVALALYGGTPDEADADGVMLVENALAWFALEEVGHALESISEE